MAEQKKSVMYCSKSNNISTKRLFDLIRGGEEEVDTIQTLLQEGVDIDAKDSNGYTPIMLACSYGKEKIVDLLIKSGANVDGRVGDEGAVLHSASKNGWIEIVRSLVKKVRDINIRDIEGETAIYHASRAGHMNVVKCLVEEGADVDQKNFLAVSPLVCAASKSHKDVVYLLLNSKENVDSYEWMFLYDIASGFKWTKVIQSLLKIHTLKTDLQMLKRSEKVFRFAARRGYLEAVKYFVDEGIDINTRDRNGKTALNVASGIGHLEVVKYLVEAGIVINSQDNCGDTALHKASIRGHLEVIKWLVEKGADIDIKNHHRKTPLMCALCFDSKDTIELLLHLGAKLDTYNDASKYTVLHLAARNGWIDIVKFLVKGVCDLEARDGRGHTALSIACRHKHLDVIQSLLQAGASWDVADIDGISPLNYLVFAGKPKFKYMKLFIENGAYFKPFDYGALVASSSLEVLQDVKLSCQAIVNRFNNHDLPELFKLPASESLPRIEQLRIVNGSEVAQTIEQTVGFEIHTKGYCNILKVCPIVLSLFAVGSVLEYFEKKKSELQSRLKRPAAFDSNNKCQLSNKALRLS